MPCDAKEEKCWVLQTKVREKRGRPLKQHTSTEKRKDEEKSHWSEGFGQRLEQINSEEEEKRKEE